MRKIMKRGFCLFLVAVLLAGLVPCAFADEAKTSEEVETSEAATEAAKETTAPPETAVPSETTEPPSETTEPPEATETTESETEVTEPEADPVEDAPEDVVEDERLAAYASTVTNVLLFDNSTRRQYRNGIAGGQRRSLRSAQDRLNRLCPHSHGYRFLSDAVRRKSLAAP